MGAGIRGRGYAICYAFSLSLACESRHGRSVVLYPFSAREDHAHTQVSISHTTGTENNDNDVSQGHVHGRGNAMPLPCLKRWRTAHIQYTYSTMQLSSALSPGERVPDQQFGSWILSSPSLGVALCSLAAIQSIEEIPYQLPRVELSSRSTCEFGQRERHL